MTLTMPVESAWVEKVCSDLSQALGHSVRVLAQSDRARPLPVEPGSPTTTTLWEGALLDSSREPFSILRIDRGLSGANSTAPTTDVAPETAVAVLQAVLPVLQRALIDQMQLTRRSTELVTLMDVYRSLPATSHLESIVDRWLTAATQLTGFWGSAFFRTDTIHQRLQLSGTQAISPKAIPHPERSFHQPTPDGVALRDRVVLLTSDCPHDLPWLPVGCRLALGVPVRTANGPIGILWCFERRQEIATGQQIHAAQSVATQLGIALERSSLLADRADRQRLTSELRSAAHHHVPRAGMLRPATAQLDVALRSATAAEVGGDLCEVWPLSDSRTAFALGDAVGHSIPAAMVMAVARGALRSIMSGESPIPLETAAVMQRINQALCSVTRSEQFMSLILGIVDHTTQTLTYTNAGHPLPLLIRQRNALPLRSHGMILGVLPEANYGQSSMSLEAEDVIMLFSDGVSEARSPCRTLFGSDGLIEGVMTAVDRSAEALATNIWQRMQSHVDASAARDDQTLLILRWTEASVPAAELITA